LPNLVNLICEAAQDLDYELIIVDDGSQDHTKNVLTELSLVYPKLRFVTIINSGAGVARNQGCAIATKDVVLFLGDDIIPANQAFISSHAKFHQLHPELNFAVLGKVDWPGQDTFEVTPVMRHITGPHGEQFGFEHMSINRCYNWPFFYTCNVSVKRNVTNDWIDQGFSVTFTGAGFEDGEFAYRMEKKYGRFNIFYTDESEGLHFHRHDVTSFLRRQRFAGAMAKVLCDLHPELLPTIDFADCLNSLKNNSLIDLNNIQRNLLLIKSILSRIEETCRSRSSLSTFRLSLFLFSFKN